MTTFILLFGSCSSAKSSKGKGGGWYENRNVGQLDVKEGDAIVYLSEENILGNQACLE